MNKTFIILAALCLSSTSYAVVADRFRCSIEIKDFDSKSSAKQNKDFFIARLPTSPNFPPGPTIPSDITFTSSRVSERIALNTPEAEFRANLNFYFKHAVKSSSNGPIEARQFTCITLTGSYCKHSKDPHSKDLQMCDEGLNSCLESSNPFDPDPNGRWAPTSLAGMIPAFNEQTLVPASSVIHDRDGRLIGEVNLSCQHAGTFN